MRDTCGVAIHLKDLTQRIVAILCPPRVTSSADWTPSRAPAELQEQHDNWEGRGSEVIMDCSRSQRVAYIPWAAQMSAGFMRYHQESFQAAGKVCWHCSDCVNYIFVLLVSLCVWHMSKECLLLEHCRFPALTENTSCGAKQHLIYCCAQPCGVATAPPVN